MFIVIMIKQGKQALNFAFSISVITFSVHLIFFQEFLKWPKKGEKNFFFFAFNLSNLIKRPVSLSREYHALTSS